ncbi:multiple C2 and transmembrane domain-containing protein isoform X1 [Athalia rosae]|uniref:multiple C2 and transmembrane domain-containing protein isoform X1 n=1 Tax=Athalia rosae TaxID=37344 RepID=UPI0020349BED|nr:multiple C2 and transmembrane domain-containing protein isoform X1 [Athalia rosae]
MEGELRDEDGCQSSSEQYEESASNGNDTSVRKNSRISTAAKSNKFDHGNSDSAASLRFLSLVNNEFLCAEIEHTRRILRETHKISTKIKADEIEGSVNGEVQEFPEDLRSNSDPEDDLISEETGWRKIKNAIRGADIVYKKTTGVEFVKEVIMPGEEEVGATGGEKLENYQGLKSKSKKPSIRSVLERRVERMEKMLENHVERVLEENIERHPWLQPIETWINEKCRVPSPTADLFAEDKTKDYNDSERKCSERFTGSPEPAGAERLKKNFDDQKIERTIIEHFKNLRAKHEKIQSKMQESKASRKVSPTSTQQVDRGFKIRESNSDHRLFERKVLENFRGISKSGGSSPVAPKRNKITQNKKAEKTGDGEENSPSDLNDLPHGSKNPSFLHSIPKESLLIRSHTVPEPTPGSPKSTPEFKHSVTPPPNVIEKAIDHQESNTGENKIHTHQDFIDKIKEGFREKSEELYRYFQRNTRLVDVNRKLKSQIWSSVVTIVLVEAKNLLPMDIDGLSDPYVKFRLGTEKYKSKVVHKTLSPVWLEQFDLHLYEDMGFGQELEVTIWDRDKSRDDLMGRTVINLATMEREKTHRLWRDLEDGAGSVFLLLTISGTTASETISDLAAHEETPQERALLLQRYSFIKTLQRPQDVGHLTVKVFRAQGLAAADLGGKSDPFCVLELVNARLQTQTEYKTLAPNWQKIFTFNVKDINSVLEVTVYDEDRDHKVEFLGRVAIPLLRIHNGEKRWYALKDKKLRGRAKGNSPQILLEMTVVWNPLRACVRTLNPKERKYMEPEVKFKRQVFLRNVLRLKAIIVFFIDHSKYIQSCFEWESTPRSIIAFALFIFLCYYFEPYMIPTAALLVFLKYYIVALVTGWPAYQSSSNSLSPSDLNDHSADEAPSTPAAIDDDDDDDDKDKEEKKSLKERLHAIQEVTQTVQNSIGYIASLGESIKNTFNFTVPYLSYLAMVLAFIGAIVLYFVPIRYLIMAWGINKFFRKILRPHTIPNNELLDLLSRVPDDEDLISYRELKPVPTPDCERSGVASGTAGNAGRKEQRRKKAA